MESTTLTTAWAAPWRTSGVSNDTPGSAGAPLPTRWHLQRPCALKPSQLAAACAAGALATLAVGLVFWFAGAPVVLAFSIIVVVTLLVAFGCHAVHASDGETIEVDDGGLHVESRRGLRSCRVTLPLADLRVDALAAQAGVRLHAGGRGVVVGTCTTPGRRLDCARGLVAALARRPAAQNSNVELIGR
jgi:uncharacterized membrane protein